jgi:type I restriction enzyme S subunit
MKDHLEREALGVTMANLNSEIVGALPISLPPLGAQQQFAAVASEVEVRCRRLLASDGELGALFASLQQRTFAGQL